MQMMRLVRGFFVKYVKSVPSNKMKAPPINCHTSGVDKASAAAYNEFLKLTSQIAHSATLIATLDNTCIQRSQSNCNYFVQ